MSVEQATLFEYEEPQNGHVGAADVLGDACYDEDCRELMQSSNGNEAYQVRGLRTMRSVSEPAYTVLAAGPAAFYPPDFMGSEELERDDVRVRKFTEQEMALLQTFSKDYCFVGDTKTSLRRQIGNAVPPLLALRLAEAVAET